MNLTEVTDLTSIGTLFAFILVCGGTLRIPRSQGGVNRFKTPYFNSKYIFPALVLTVILGLVRLRPDELKQFLSLTEFSWIHLQPKIPLLVFSVCMIPLSWMCYRYEFSLIPVLGVSTCGYLMTELGITNWIRFGIWLLLGLVIYFLYGIKHSRLKPQR